MLVEYDDRIQRLVVRDDDRRILFTQDYPTPQDIEYWRTQAAKMRRVG